MKKEVFNPDDWNTPNVGREPMCSPTSLSSKGEGRGEALSWMPSKPQASTSHPLTRNGWI